MTTTADVLVAGGGAVGAACAWALCRAGATVRVIQPPALAGEAWRASAGMLAAQIEADANDPGWALDLAGREFYREHAAVLRAESGIDIGLLECGVVQLALHEADAAPLRARVAWQQARGQQAEWLDPEVVRSRWPWLAPSVGAFWSPNDGALDPLRLVDAFRTASQRAGAEWITDRVRSIDRTGNTLLGAIGDRGRYPAGAVVIASGAWAGSCLDLPRPLPVRPVRGQMAAFPWPDGVDPAVVYGAGGYLLCRGMELLAGSTMEEAGFDAAVTEAGRTGIQQRASAVYPALRRMSPTRTWAGLRPGTPDGRPIVGAEPALPGLWYAAGHGRKGIVLAGVTAERIAASIIGHAGDDPRFAALDPARFST
jgi:glycine oxidase